MTVGSTIISLGFLESDQREVELSWMTVGWIWHLGQWWGEKWVFINDLIQIWVINWHSTTWPRLNLIWEVWHTQFRENVLIHTSWFSLSSSLHVRLRLRGDKCSKSFFAPFKRFAVRDCQEAGRLGMLKARHDAFWRVQAQKAINFMLPCFLINLSISISSIAFYLRFDGADKNQMDYILCDYGFCPERPDLVCCHARHMTLVGRGCPLPYETCLVSSTCTNDPWAAKRKRCQLMDGNAAHPTRDHRRNIRWPCRMCRELEDLCTTL